MQRSRLNVLLGLALAALASGAACGPSVQSIYEGNVRFEHCNRLDLDSNIASSHREACWREWLKVYTYAQVRDRIEHARRRLRTLEQGDPSRPVLNIDGTRRPEERSWYLSSPSPTSAHASPPPMAPASAPPDAGKAAAAPPLASKQTAPTPQAECTVACQERWDSCRDFCGADAADPKPKSCGACEPDYKKCMRRCFE